MKAKKTLSRFIKSIIIEEREKSERIINAVERAKESFFELVRNFSDEFEQWSLNFKL